MQQGTDVDAIMKIWSQISIYTSALIWQKYHAKSLEIYTNEEVEYTWGRWCEVRVCTHPWACESHSDTVVDVKAKVLTMTALTVLLLKESLKTEGAYWSIPTYQF